MLNNLTNTSLRVVIVPNPYGFLLDYESIKNDFPLLVKTDIVYLDNAATSQKPLQVINAIKRFYEEYNANIHRGVYDLSMRASEEYEQAHDLVAEFINARGREEIVFVKNTTEALNMLAMALSHKLLETNSNIVITVMEHHSNMLPWLNIARLKNIEVRFARVSREGLLDYSDLENKVDEKTRVVAVTHLSNVLGVVNDVKRIARIAHSVDAVVVVDGAQSVPHIPVDVRELGIDFLAFSGHKMLGPTGIGVLWGRKDLLEELYPPITGGGMVKSVEASLDNWIQGVDVELAGLPWRFEAGTPNIAGGIGLAEAIRYLGKIGMENIERHEKTLTRYLLKRLNEELRDKIELVGPWNPDKRSGIVSFNVKNYNPHVVAAKLSLDNIAVRSGFHCAQPLHLLLGFNEGSVRASFYLYNSPEDVDRLVESLASL